MQGILSTLGQSQVIAMIAGMVLLLSWESLRPFMDLFHRSGPERTVHFMRNIALGAFNSVVISVVFVGLWTVAAVWAETSRWGLLNLLSDRLIDSPIVHLAGAVVLFDAWTYTWHRLNHRIPFLWRFHRVHHSDRQMDVSTAGRFHLGEIVLSSALRVPLMVLFGAYLWELIFYETVMFAVVQFHHANVGLPAWLDRALRTVIVTPAMHKVHHSRLQPETDSNYAALLSVWDRIGRSFRLRARPSEIQFGLDEYADASFDTMPRLLTMPLDPVRPERSGRKPL